MTSKKDILNAVYGQIIEAMGTPYILVKVDKNTRVPMAYVKDGKIVLNISMISASNLFISDVSITFAARFSGKHYDIDVPLENVMAIYARESGQGVFFEEVPAAADDVTVEQVTYPDPKFTDQKFDKVTTVVTIGGGNNPGTISVQPEQPKRPSLKLVK